MQSKERKNQFICIVILNIKITKEYSKIHEFINFFVREIEYLDFNSSVSLLFFFPSYELQIIEECHQF